MNLTDLDRRIIAWRVAMEGGSCCPWRAPEAEGIDPRVWQDALYSTLRRNGGAFPLGGHVVDEEIGTKAPTEAIMKNYRGIIGGILLMLLLLILGVLLLAGISQAADCTTMAAGSISRLECEGMAAKIDQHRKTEAALQASSHITIRSPEVDEITATCGDSTDKAFLATCRRVAGEALLKRRAELARLQAIEDARAEAEQQRWMDSHRTTTCSTNYGYRYTSTSCSSF